MKKLIYILLLVPLGFTACEFHPVADFYPDEYEVYIGEEIWFTNESYNAVEFDWDFDDGTWTDVENPIHTYSASGSYDVVLTAYSRKGTTDEYSVTITVLTPTILEIEVLDWDFEDPIPGANVRLYPTVTDWEDETRMVIEGNTNSNGKVVFFDLEQTHYFVDAWAPDFNNFTLKLEDLGFITTQTLVPNEINSFIAWVDYVGGKKGTSSERDRTLIIKKLERVPKK